MILLLGCGKDAFESQCFDMVIKHMLLLQSVVGIVLVFVVGAGIVSYSLLRRKGLQEYVVLFDFPSILSPLLKMSCKYFLE